MTLLSNMSTVQTSAAAACQGVLRMVSQNLNDELVFLVNDYTPGDVKLAVKALTRRLGPGSTLSHREATFYVVAVSTTSSQVEVVAGYDGGQDVALPAGTALRVNPRFTDYTVFDSVAASVGALSSPAYGLFGVQVDMVTGMRVDKTYPIPGAYAGSVEKVLKVSQRDSGSEDWEPIASYTVSLTPGNEHVRIFTDALQYEIVYATRIEKPLSFDSDLVTDCGLASSMLDIPVLGAASTLMFGQEARRVNQKVQGDPRRAEDVPITGATGAARELRRIYEQRIEQEHARQISLYSYRMG